MDSEDSMRAMNDIVDLILKLVGTTESVIINTGIYNHYGENTTPQLNINEDNYLIEATKDNPITILHIKNVTSYILKQYNNLLDKGIDCKSYYYGNIEFDKDKNLYQVYWNT